MLIADLVSSVRPWALASTAAGILCLRVASFRYHKGLNKYNGPFLASFTNFWRLWQWLWYWDRTYFLDLVKYGKIIRVGPDTLLFNDPAAIKDIYTTGFAKSDFYTVAQGVSRGVVVPNIFSTTDRAYHAMVRRSVSNAFTMSTLIQYEPFVAETVSTFLRVLDDRFTSNNGPGPVFDIADWSKYFALDVVSTLTMGEPYGLLEAGYDHVGIIKARTGLLRYFTVVNNVPWLDKVLKKNPILLWLGRMGIFNSVTPTVPIAQRQIAQKSRDFKPMDESVKSVRARVDLLTRFLQAKVDHPEIIDDRAVLGLALSIVNAGSGTVSTTLSAIIYFLLQDPTAMERLIDEIDSHFPPPTSKGPSVNFVDYVVPFSEAQQLPFLDAVIKEIYRIWPSLGAQHIERLTPPEGAYIMGEFIPGDVIVTCVAWVMHRDKPTYGEDSDQFRPSRWLEADQQQLAAMNRTLLTFGSGPNTCIGKNIALLELYTAVPALLRAFKESDAHGWMHENTANNGQFELADATKPWKMYNLGDPEPYDIFVRLTPRYHKDS